jgi:hypothetical protein
VKLQKSIYGIEMIFPSKRSVYCTYRPFLSIKKWNFRRQGLWERLGRIFMCIVLRAREGPTQWGLHISDRDTVYPRQMETDTLVFTHMYEYTFRIGVPLSNGTPFKKLSFLHLLINFTGRMKLFINHDEIVRVMKVHKLPP